VSESPGLWGDTSGPVHEAKCSDEIVGRAFRWSIGCMVLGGCVALFIWLLTPPAAPQVEEFVPPSFRPPRAQELPPEAFPRTPFVEIAQAAGVRFRHINGAGGNWLMPEILGAGVAFFDFDGDGAQ
jgi:hypothetical protein